LFSIEGALEETKLSTAVKPLALQKYCIEGCMRTFKAGKCNTYQQQLRNEIGHGCQNMPLENVPRLIDADIYKIRGMVYTPDILNSCANMKIWMHGVEF